MSIGLTVREFVSSKCHGNTSCEFDNQIKAYSYLKIVREFDGCVIQFPQKTKKYKNVFNWYLLEDGTSLGWNESPRTGYSFPRSGKEITKLFVDYFDENLR